MGASGFPEAKAYYWHVGNKDNLVRLAGDEVRQEIDLPDLDSLDWRTAAATVFIFVLGSAASASATIALTRRLNRGGGDAVEQLRDTMARASEIAMTYPRLRSRLQGRRPPSTTRLPTTVFALGLEAIPDGFGKRLAAQRTAAGSRDR